MYLACKKTDYFTVIAKKRLDINTLGIENTGNHATHCTVGYFEKN